MAHKTIKIGARRHTMGGRVPKLVLAADVGGTVNHPSGTIDDDEGVVRIALVFDQATDDKTVVDAVAIGSDEIGEGEQAVAVVAIPKDVEVVVDDAVATRLVGEDEGHVADGVVEKAVEEWPRELFFDDGVVYDSVACCIDEEKTGNGAVLPIAALQQHVDHGVAMGGGAVEVVGQLVGTDIGVGGVEDIVYDMELVVHEGVAGGQEAGKKQRVRARSLIDVSVKIPRKVILHNGVGVGKGVVGQEGEPQDAEGVAGEGGNEQGVGARLGEWDVMPEIGQLGRADGTRQGVAHLTAASRASERETVGRPAVAQHLQPIDADEGNGVVVGGGGLIETEHGDAMRAGGGGEMIAPRHAERRRETVAGQLDAAWVEEGGVAHAPPIARRKEDAGSVVDGPGKAE